MVVLIYGALAVCVVFLLGLGVNHSNLSFYDFFCSVMCLYVYRIDIFLSMFLYYYIYSLILLFILVLVFITVHFLPMHG